MVIVMALEATALTDDGKVNIIHCGHVEQTWMKRVTLHGLLRN